MAERLTFTDEELDMLISGCVHYGNVYGDLGNNSTLARERQQQYVELRTKLQNYKSERAAWFKVADEFTELLNNTEIVDPRDHDGYDDDCHI